MFGMIAPLLGSVYDPSANLANNQQYMAAMQALAAAAYPTIELPAGIFWERTGGKTHTVTIRREPERALDSALLVNAWRPLGGYTPMNRYRTTWGAMIDEALK